MCSGILLSDFYLRKKIIRGALTTGDCWMFIIVRSRGDKHRASYWMTAPIILLEGKLIQSNMHDVIAGILFHWVSQCMPVTWTSTAYLVVVD